MKTYILKAQKENGEWKAWPGIESRSAITWTKIIDSEQTKKYKLVLITEINGKPLSGATWVEILETYKRIPNKTIAKMKEEWYNKNEEGQTFLII